MSDLSLQIQWVLIPVFAAYTGYTVKAVQRKIQEGIWIEGRHYRKVRGRIHMNIAEYHRWVEAGG